MDVFVLDLATLPAGPSEVVVEADPGRLGLEPEAWSGSVQGRLRVERSGEQVTVRGTLRATAQLECARCLGPAVLEIRAPLEIFAQRGGGRRHELDEALERDDYMLFHDGRKLDLREQARETLLLEVPMTPWCRPDCRGLCPRCGADLNQGPCGCAPQAE